MRKIIVAIVAATFVTSALVAEEPDDEWLWSRAFAIPKETTSEGSGYFSIIQGGNERIYIGTAKYRENAYLVEFDPASGEMKVVVDVHAVAGIEASGFAAQAKIHTRNQLGESGKIYFGSKQGYPQEGEDRDEYPGGFPLVFDPQTGQTKAYPIAIAHQGVISVMPDESRGVAYISTCSDERPIESTHFMILDLESGEYRDLLDCRHMYAFIVLDHLGRAYHPILGGEIARFDPRTDTLERLRQTIDGQFPGEDSLLTAPQSHPINWEVSPDRKTLYAIAMSGNQLYGYDLTAEGEVLPGRSLGKLSVDAESTDCRALCVAADGVVWAGIAAKHTGQGEWLRLISYRPGDAAPRDHGRIGISNPDYTEFTGPDGQPLPHHHAVARAEDGTLYPRYNILGICAADDGTVYVTSLAPFTLHAIKLPAEAQH